MGAPHGTNLVAAILNGVDRTTAEGQAYMPAFGGSPSSGVDALTDAQIAAVGNYVLASYGNGQATITAEQVAEGRRGGPSSPLVLLARVALGAGAVLVLSLLAFLAWRRTRKGDPS